MNTTAEAMRLLDACGVDIIELGVPYSDPLADGPVIQACSSFTTISCCQCYLGVEYGYITKIGLRDDMC